MMTKAQRSGMTMVEVVVIGAVGLLVVGIVASLVASAWRQDNWTAHRLDAVSAVAATMETLRHDLWHADAAQTDPAKGLFALRVNLPGAKAPEVALYGWTGAGNSLTRNGRPLGVAKPDGFGVHVEDDVAVFDVSIPAGQTPSGAVTHETRLAIPLVVPDAHWSETCSYWAPSL